MPLQWGHLVETVAGSDRTDLHRLEEDVVARVPGHGWSSLARSRDAIRRSALCELDSGKRGHPNSRVRGTDVRRGTPTPRRGLPRIDGCFLRFSTCMESLPTRCFPRIAAHQENDGWWRSGQRRADYHSRLRGNDGKRRLERAYCLDVPSATAGIGPPGLGRLSRNKDDFTLSAGRFGTDRRSPVRSKGFHFVKWTSDTCGLDSTGRRVVTRRRCRPRC